MDEKEKKTKLYNLNMILEINIPLKSNNYFPIYQLVRLTYHV